MTHYADLTPYTYLPDSSAPPRGTDHVLNVGWLDEAEPYPKGPVPTGLAETLHRMTRTHRTRQTRGHHYCPWCAPLLRQAHRFTCPKGSAEIRVPGLGVTYAAPELIAHYVEAHAYLPPPGFVAAVLSADSNA